eukprot:TRINITY_DN600_c0_g1_i1.p1 TRINITY_DN600_c0_g1~~TRINITY_DN600_c0_g1_i1.p1  ORF type:complete len:299 (-),score=95.78 TRINITY_DN600_c0_g1_i1:112-1008(-)
MRVAAQVVVGTPGKMVNMLSAGQLSVSKVKVFVLDEADIMLRDKLGEATIQIKRCLPRDCMYMMLSATFSETLIKFSKESVPQPVASLRLKPHDLVVSSITQLYINCSVKDRFTALQELYSSITIAQSIIFVNTIGHADSLCEAMRKDFHKVSLIHGEMPPSERDAVIKMYKNFQTRVLIASNVLARGFDVPQVTLVINYELPIQLTPRTPATREKGKDRAPEAKEVDTHTYIHRIGRTGRFALFGVAVNFVNADEMPLLASLEQYWGCKILELNDFSKLVTMLEQCKAKNEARTRGT